ncbi:MAG: hypothetical protein ACI4XL_14240 [Bacillus sp. (in: firmicutes)]
MKMQDVILGAAIGFVAGYATKCAVDKYVTNQSPDSILSQVKEAMKSKGRVIGSWILMTPETIKKNGLEYKVYKGGLTTIEEDEQTQYAFTADATSGTILEMSPQ